MKILLISFLVTLGGLTTNYNSSPTENETSSPAVSYSASDLETLAEEGHPCLASCMELPLRTHCGVELRYQYCHCPWFPEYKFFIARPIQDACGTSPVGGGAP